MLNFIKSYKKVLLLMVRNTFVGKYPRFEDIDQNHDQLIDKSDIENLKKANKKL
jgi:hypothetical protein